MKRLVLGTRNAKKRWELEQLLGPHGFQLQGLDAFDSAVEVEETGSTFAENAALKATQQAAAIGHWVLGEDSGLIVDALEGRPGVYSARYAGLEATDSENNAKLLAELHGVPEARRTARYVCHLALANPQGELEVSCEATCEGRIAVAERGSHGFGYDPLFVIPEFHRSFGLLGPAAKAAISHRSRAIRAFIPRVLRLANRW